MPTIWQAVGSDRGGRRAVVLQRPARRQQGQQRQRLALGPGLVLLAGQTGLLGLREVSVRRDEGCAWQLLLRRGRGRGVARGLVCEQGGCVYELDEGLPVDVVLEGGGDAREQGGGRGPVVGLERAGE